MATLNLVQQETVDLDAPITRYLTRYDLPAGEFDADAVTIRRLLQHTGGTNVHGYGGYGAHERQPTDALQLSTDFQPVVIVRDPGSDR